MSPRQPQSASGGGATAVKRRGPSTRAVIMAAGLGTRMKSRLPKVLHEVCGRPMLAYVIEAAHEATGQKPIVVYSPQTEQICEAFAGQADFALQQSPNGTGDAVRSALASLPEHVTDVAVLSGDVPLIEAASVDLLVDLRRKANTPMALAAVEFEDPTGYGRVELGSKRTIKRIVEEKDATAKQRENRLINAGLYAFDAGWLREAVGRLSKSAKTGEIYLTELVELAAKDGTPAIAVEEPDDADWESELMGINDRSDLAEIQFFLQYDILQGLMEAGVTLHDPATTVIEAGVKVAADVTIEASVALRGNTRVGRDTLIRSGSQLIDATVGERCVIWSSVIESSTIGNDVKVGPFAHVRAGCVVDDGAEIGNYAELKNTRFGARSKQHHFSYLGDADVGEDVNIGAGTITANYDGRNKHKTVIGKGAFIGSDTILRAPLTVGEGAYTGAGSVVTKDVPPGKLAIGVPARIRERIARPDDPQVRER
ncbi:MAG: bifunctional UDP-N-acetylglucosamine diphosphorylase/glucosamine-1-phosphate N-acetyltransferase GlmU [Chloroflexota bacterium]